MNVGPVDREIPWELDLINDNLALGFVEELSLNFEVNPAFQSLVNFALGEGEFIRDSVIVSIADIDGKTTESCILNHIKSDITILNLSCI